MKLRNIIDTTLPYIEVLLRTYELMNLLRTFNPEKLKQAFKLNLGIGLNVSCHTEIVNKYILSYFWDFTVIILVLSIEV